MFDYNDVIDFWFCEQTAGKYFDTDPLFDQQIRDKFLTCHQAAACGELYQWRDTPVGRLAEVIVLDQFSRNMFRGTPQAFAFDAMALVLAQESIHRELDQQLEIEKRSFLYMPLMHSESKLIHQQAMICFSQPGLEYSYHYEILHKKIIDRFGRYPHRNEILGRVSSEEEIAFLKEENSSF